MEKHCNGVQCDDIKRLVAILPEWGKKIERLENKQESSDAIVQQLVVSDGKTTVFVELILKQVSSLENNMFSYMKQAIKEARIIEQAENKGQREERMNSELLDHEERINKNKEDIAKDVKITIGWHQLIKYVVGGTIVALIGGIIALGTAYIKLKGGK